MQTLPHQRSIKRQTVQPYQRLYACHIREVYNSSTAVLGSGNIDYVHFFLHQFFISLLFRSWVRGPPHGGALLYQPLLGRRPHPVHEFHMTLV